MNRRWPRTTLVPLALLVPGLAHAGNGLNPRTPTLWEDVPCMALDDALGEGRVLWVELDPSVDPCTSTRVASVVDLTASAPQEPATWRRGPNAVLVHEYR